MINLRSNARKFLKWFCWADCYIAEEPLPMSQCGFRRSTQQPWCLFSGISGSRRYIGLPILDVKSREILRSTMRFTTDWQGRSLHLTNYTNVRAITFTWRRAEWSECIELLSLLPSFKAQNVGHLVESPTSLRTVPQGLPAHTILNIHWRDIISNTEIIENSKITSRKSMLRKSKLLWDVDVSSMGNHQLPKILLYDEIFTG